VFAPIYVTLDNAGSISGTSGAALANTGGYSVQFTRITNRATGTIGAIAGTFGIIQNDGLIDGGAMAAIDTAGGYITGTVNNTGTIRSANGVATIANTQLTLNNSGTDQQHGRRRGHRVDRLGSIINQAGGTITANGATTISASGNLSLNNLGQVDNTGLGGTTISGSSVGISNGVGR
jgi:hypothetical protein